MSMHIAGMELNLTHKALEIFVSGCTRNCAGCHNPELQKYGVGKKWQRWLRENTSKLNYEWSMLVDKLWIVGGDILCQPPEDAREFLMALRKAAPSMDICVWTGARYSEIPDFVFKFADVVKVGEYIDGTESIIASYPLIDDSHIPVTLASANQYFRRVNYVRTAS